MKSSCLAELLMRWPWVLGRAADEKWHEDLQAFVCDPRSLTGEQAHASASSLALLLDAFRRCPLPDSRGLGEAIAQVAHRLLHTATWVLKTLEDKAAVGKKALDLASANREQILQAKLRCSSAREWRRQYARLLLQYAFQMWSAGDHQLARLARRESLRADPINLAAWRHCLAVRKHQWQAKAAEVSQMAPP